MNCLKCNNELDIESSGKNEYGYYIYYICSQCNKLHLCVSQDGVMIQEKLDLLN